MRSRWKLPLSTTASVDLILVEVGAPERTPTSIRCYLLLLLVLLGVKRAKVRVVAGRSVRQESAELRSVEEPVLLVEDRHVRAVLARESLGLLEELDLL